PTGTQVLVRIVPISSERDISNAKCGARLLEKERFVIPHLDRPGLIPEIERHQSCLPVGMKQPKLAIALPSVFSPYTITAVAGTRYVSQVNLSAVYLKSRIFASVCLNMVDLGLRSQSEKMEGMSAVFSTIFCPHKPECTRTFICSSASIPKSIPQ